MMCPFKKKYIFMTDSRKTVKIEEEEYIKETFGTCDYGACPYFNNNAKIKQYNCLKIMAELSAAGLKSVDLQH